MMNQEDIFKKIGQILNELQDQYDFLAQNPQQLNELELELFLANANFLSDHVDIVRKINSSKLSRELAEPTPQVIQPIEVEAEKPLLVELEAPEPENQQEEPEVNPLEAPEMEQIELEELQQEDVVAPEHERPSFEFMLNEPNFSDKFDFEEKSIGEIFDRPLSEQEQNIIAAKQKQTETQAEPFVVRPEPQPVAAIVLEAAPAFPLDKVEDKEVSEVNTEMPVVDKVEEKQVQSSATAPRPTLNELLAAKSSGTVSFNQGNQKPAVTDLRTGISLNEKLLYIKDLFNGYNLAYSEAIDLINKMPDLKTADVFLQKNYAEKNNWSAKQQTVDRFYALLAQRFPEG